MSKTVEISDLSDSLDREPTAIHRQFSEWLMDKTGYDPSEHSAEEAWIEAIKLGALHRGDFQRSPENRSARDERAKSRKDALEERRAANEQRKADKKEREAARAAKAEAAAERKAAAKAKADAKAEAKAEAEAGEEPQTPAKTPRKRASKKAAPVAEDAAPAESGNVAPIRNSRKTAGARKKSASAPSPF